MSRPCLLGAVLVGGAALASPAAHAAPAVAVVGEVEAVASRWTASGDRILTDATIRQADGQRVVVSQLGGTADGLTMREFVGGRGLPLLAVGQLVEVESDGGTRTATGALVARSIAVTRDVPGRQGFVRTGPTAGGAYVRWESGCAQLALQAGGTVALPDASEFEVVDEVVATWNAAVQACSYMNLVVTGTTDADVARDLTNVVVFRDDRWCRPATADDVERCHSPSAAGLTTVTYIDDVGSGRDGTIVDADVELNGVDFGISRDGVTLGDTGCLADLGNTLTHELGHLLGLEHTCRQLGDPERVDGAGQPVPLCTDPLTPAVTEATMFYSQTCGETKKATLEADDINAICSIYPVAEDPGVCEPATLDGDAGCCQSGRGGAAGPLLLGLATLTGLTRRRRRR